MHYYLVTPLKIVHGSQAALTYQFTDALEIGAVVIVPVGKSQVAGVVTGETTKPSFATKDIVSLIEQSALPSPLIGLAEWVSQYYATHPVAVWQTILPRGITKTRRQKTREQLLPTRKIEKRTLNNEQQAAVNTVLSTNKTTSLLHGITGSGKTAVYIELAKQMLAQKKSTILLVPEIALTSQLIAEFTPHFPQLIVTHSRMSEAERHTVWQTLLRSTTPQLVIGPRSALFSPLHDLGLIIIDECHEPSFKQEQSPRYSAIRTASKLASLSQAKLVLGSATPSVTDYYLALQSGSPIIELTKPARQHTVLPEVTIVDMTKQHNFSRHRFFSNTMLAQITETLAAGHQALVFHNRRGTAPTTLCESCGWNAACPRCFVPLTLHADSFELRCHICNHTERVPTSCPVCGEAKILHKGIGTKLLHEELKKLFTKARIARFDGDTEAAETLEKQYQALYDGDIDIIIGTQVVAKGLDLPKLRAVYVVQADSGLSLPDYQSPERVFQLISQVCGRVGRNEHKSHVVVQSYQPHHPAVEYGFNRDYAGFYESTLTERKRAHFPPFTHLMKIVCTYKTEDAAIRNTKQLAQTLRRALPKHAELLGPTPAFYERVRDTYRWQIVVKSPVRDDLVQLVSLIPPAKWQYELDPASLL